MVDVERDNNENNEYVYYFLMERAPARSQGQNGGWGWVVQWLGGRWGVTLYFLSIVKIYCVGPIMRRGGLPIFFKRDGNSRISRMDC